MQNNTITQNKITTNIQTRWPIATTITIDSRARRGSRLQQLAFKSSTCLYIIFFQYYYNIREACNSNNKINKTSMSDLVRSSCSMEGSVRARRGALECLRTQPSAAAECNARTAGPCPACMRAPCRTSSGRMWSFILGSLCAPAHEATHTYVYIIVCSAR